jgi:membrane-associated phospholipid phosphatase
LLVALTEFGDAAVLLPLAAMIFLWLLLSGTTRAAVSWIFSVLVCVAATAASKIFFWGCPPMSDLHSPSGHTGLSVLVYGTTALITAVEGGAWRPRIAVVGGVARILAIAVSRLLLDNHTVPEVIVGWVIGGVSVAFFGHRYWRLRPKNVQLTPLLLGMTMLALALHGTELRAEQLLHRITDSLRIARR